jgi:hypothetical protein
VISREIDEAIDSKVIEQCLIDYIQVANDQSSGLNLELTKEQDSALRIMQLAIVKIEECSRHGLLPELYQELFYDTYNNMARVLNIRGDIKGSLVFLKMSLSHVKDWCLNPNKVQDVV